MEYINIEKNNIPYQFDIRLQGETFTLAIYYNTLGDFFTIDLIKDESVLVLGEKIVYNTPLFQSVKYKNVPKVDIIPFDISDNSDRITFENFNNEVLLYLVGV